MAVSRLKAATLFLDRHQQRSPALGFLYGVVKKYGDDRGGQLAALIAYYGFLSLFPLLLVLVTVLGIVAGSSSSLTHRVEHSALAQFPVIGSHLIANIHALHKNSAIGLVVGCLLYTSLVVAQGTEAGGHTGQVATMPLVPQVVDAVGDKVPVVAAGGIFDGRGLAAALALGADGVWVGTRFIATPEARSVAGYKEALLAAGEDSTLITRAYSGKPMRVLRNDYTNHFVEHPDEIEAFPTQLRNALGANAWHLGGDEGTELSLIHI